MTPQEQEKHFRAAARIQAQLERLIPRVRIAGPIEPKVAEVDDDLWGGLVINHGINDRRLEVLMQDYHLIPSGPRHTIVVKRQQ